MAQFDENIRINVDLDVDTSGLRRAREALDEVRDSAAEAAASLEPVEDQLSDVRDEALEAGTALRSMPNEVDMDVRFTESSIASQIAKVHALVAAGPPVSFDARFTNSSIAAQIAKTKAMARAAEVEMPVHLIGPASRVFGELEGSFDFGGESLEQAGETLEEAGETLGEAADELTDTVTDGGDGDTGFLQSFSHLLFALRSGGGGGGGGDGFLSGMPDAFDNLGDAIVGLGVNIGPVSTRIGSLKTALIGLALALGLAGIALGGLMTAITGAVSVFAVAAGGLLAQADAVVARFEEVETRMQAFRVILLNLRDDLLAALQPLIQAEGAVETFRAVADGFIQFVSQLAQVGEVLAPVVNRMVRSLEAPEQLFVELAAAGRQLIPIFGDALQFLLDEGPAIVRFFTRLAVLSADLWPILAKLFAVLGMVVLVLVDLLNALSPVLGVIADVIMALSLFVSGIVKVATTIARVIDFLIQKLDRLTLGVIPGEGPTPEELSLQFGASPAMESFAPQQDLTRIEENDYSTTNIIENVNADPEDKESLKRIVKDAIAEANAFSRRQQGGV